MGARIGAGVGPPYSSDSSGASEPTGRLQVLEPKDFPFLHTGKSLVFVIARNGMVWGKRLDEQSAKGDIELEVFWPREDGCLVTEWCGAVFSAQTPLVVQAGQTVKESSTISREQIRKIESILSQKEIIQYELGTLMVPPVSSDPDYKDWRHVPQYQRAKYKCKLDSPLGAPLFIKVVDCSYLGDGWLSSTSLSSWLFRYDDASAQFQFCADRLGGKYSYLGTPEAPVNSDHIKNIESEFDNGSAKIVKRYFASQLSGRKFDMSRIELRSNVKIKPSLRIMYGEHDFFEYFEVDDAFLMLEEETVSADFPKLYWTLGIAQNKYVREMMRLASNNPDLFTPILPKTQRRVGGGCTDTL